MSFVFYVLVQVVELAQTTTPFWAYLRIGLSDRYVVMGRVKDEAGREVGDLVMWSRCETGWNDEWTRPCPDGIEFSCRKAITETGDVLLQQYSSGPTVKLSHHGQEQWQQNGYLIDCLSGGRVVYAVEKEEDDWEVVITEEGVEMMTLRPSQDTWGEWYLSVCEAAAGDILVSESNTKTLASFTREGVGKSCHTLLSVQIIK
jgi:hypothetical protein